MTTLVIMELYSLCNLAATTNTYIMSTTFKYEKEHIVTWIIPATIDGTQIYHMLISRWKIITLDVRL